VVTPNMFSINAAQCACASETTDAAFQTSSVLLLRDSVTLYRCGPVTP
jgi:hypothetical protein